MGGPFNRHFEDAMIMVHVLYCLTSLVKISADEMLMYFSYILQKNVFDIASKLCLKEFLKRRQFACSVRSYLMEKKLRKLYQYVICWICSNFDFLRYQKGLNDPEEKRSKICSMMKYGETFHVTTCCVITKTCLFKYAENFTTQKMKIFR